MNARFLSKCISTGSLLDRECKHATTAWLSQCQIMRHVDQVRPQIAQPSSIGMSSLIAIWKSATGGDHCSWNQWRSNQAPQPQEPEASEKTYHVGRCGGRGKKEVPFHWMANVVHHARSALNCWFRRIGTSLEPGEEERL